MYSVMYYSVITVSIFEGFSIASRYAGEYIYDSKWRYNAKDHGVEIVSVDTAVLDVPLGVFNPSILCINAE